MELRSIEPFIEYFEKVRARTMKVVKCIPPDKLEHSVGEGRFTLGDFARHLAVVERHTWAECVQGKPATTGAAASGPMASKTSLL
jgi:uncharacterized damage-inducible protein DinB